MLFELAPWKPPYTIGFNGGVFTIYTKDDLFAIWMCSIARDMPGSTTKKLLNLTGSRLTDDNGQVYFEAPSLGPDLAKPAVLHSGMPAQLIPPGTLVMQTPQLLYLTVTPDDPLFDAMRPLEVPRSGKWPAVDRHFLAQNPDCAVCGTKSAVVSHHIKPVHLYPDFELDPGNLIALCPPHHLLFGHLMNWRSYNHNVIKDCAHMKLKINFRPSIQTQVPAE